MDSHRFYRCQLAETVFYIIALWFLGIMAVLSIAAPPAIIYIEQFIMQQPPNWIEIISMTFAIWLIAGFFMFLFFYLKIKVGRRRKRLFAKFEQLSETEKAEINSELTGKFGNKWGHVLLGANCLYVRSAWFVDFFHYEDVAWIYRCYTAVPMVAVYDQMAEVSSFTATSLHVYDTEGTRYKIQTSGHTDANAEYIIELLKFHVPYVIIGYSKERSKRAKKDFNAFIDEEQRKL